MSITVQHGDNAYWGPHVFIQGSGDAEEIRGAYARESVDWPLLQFAIAEATPEALDPWYRLGFAQMHAYGARASGGECLPHTDALQLASTLTTQLTHIPLVRRLPDL
jgi:hypothetical protein